MILIKQWWRMSDMSKCKLWKPKSSAKFLHIATVERLKEKDRIARESKISCVSNEAVDDIILKWKYQHLRSYKLLYGLVDCLTRPLATMLNIFASFLNCINSHKAFRLSLLHWNYSVHILMQWCQRIFQSHHFAIAQSAIKHLSEKTF